MLSLSVPETVTLNMPLDKLPPEIIALIARDVDGRGLLSLILSARRFYANRILMDRLIVEKALEDRYRSREPLNLIHAALSNQVTAFAGLLNVLLQEGMPINARNIYVGPRHNLCGWWEGLNYQDRAFFHTSLLHVLCYTGSKYIIELALSKGADPLLADSEGYTPLHLAAARGRIVVMKSLLNAGVNVNVYTSRPGHVATCSCFNGPSRCTPFHLAVRENQMFAAKLLMDAGADHRVVDDEHEALILAVRGRATVEFVRYLLGLGYSKSSIDRALLAASGCGNALQGKAYLDAGARVSFDCLVEALKGDYISMLKLLVDHEVDLLETYMDGRSLLYFVRSDAAARILLEKDPCITTVGFYPGGPLSSLRDSRLEVDVIPATSVLVANGCNIDSRTMLWAAKAGHLPILEAIRKRHRPFVHIGLPRDDLGNTPLHLAMLAQSGCSVEWVELLLELGCEIGATNNLGETALHYAFGSESRGNLPMELDVSMKRLIDAGINISAQADDGTTGLHRILVNGHIWAAHLLLDAGADINLATTQGETVLHAATRGGCLEIMEKLVQKGADMSVRTKRGDTALHLAVRCALSAHTWDKNYAKMLACAVLDYEDISIEAQAKGGISSMTAHLELIRWFIRRQIPSSSVTNNKGHTAFDIIKSHEPSIDWDYLESASAATCGGRDEFTSRIVQWIMEEDVTAGLGGFDVSLEAFEGLSVLM